MHSPTTKGPLQPPLQIPLLIYDGDCGFCKKWIQLWKQLTEGHVNYAPSQEVGAEFPQVPKDQYEKSVVLVMPSGEFFIGAEAVFRSLALAPSFPHFRKILWIYQKSRFFRGCTETFYSFVARHRVLFSHLTRLFLGENLYPSTFYFSRWIFLRILGLIYLTAFVSLGIQLPGLIGSQGILPSPWSDSALQALWIGGSGLSILLMTDFAPALCLVGLWLLYFYLIQLCGQFLGFQWDALLSEMGFLAIFLAPWRLFPKSFRKIPTETAPSPSILFLMKWLLFRVVFFSGWVKLASGDPTWRNLTALSYHFETQPLPSWTSWYVHQLPSWLLQMTTGALFGVELILPILIFFPRRARILAAFFQMGLQILIDLTGNYGFFGWQVTALCLLLLDDQFWMSWVARLLPSQDSAPLLLRSWPEPRKLEPQIKRWINSGILTVVLLVTLFHLEILTELLGTLRIVNRYGVFAVMTTRRDELVIEGSQDSQSWIAYEFKYKPGDPRTPPRFVEPHMPRLDWQMWFAALGNLEENPWLQGLMARLLSGSPTVLSFFTRDPFTGVPPRYIRVLRYQYHFTDFTEWKTTGQWWKRELKGSYSPTFFLR